MARRTGWTALLAFILGIMGASLFWLYSPWFKQGMSRLAAESPKERPLPPELEKPGALAAGPRFQLISDGDQVFLGDLQEGRVWRYYRLSKEGGSGREEEGFLPLPLHFGGQKYFSAVEMDAVKPKPGEGKMRPGPP